MRLRNDFYHVVGDLGGWMSEQIEHDFEAFLARDLFKIGPAPRGDFHIALRKSVIEHVKIQFTEQFRISIVSSRRSRGDGLSVDSVSRQFRLVDMHDGVERIKNERGIMHGSTG